MIDFATLLKAVLPDIIRGEGAARITPATPVGWYRVRGTVRELRVETAVAKRHYPAYTADSRYSHSATARIGSRVARCAFFKV